MSWLIIVKKNRKTNEVISTVLVKKKMVKIYIKYFYLLNLLI